MDTENLVIGGIGVAIVAIVIWISMRRAKKRSGEVAALAQTIGMSFEGEKWSDPTRSQDLTTQLFRKGSSRRFVNIMTGTSQGMPARLFDYAFVEGSNAQSRTVQQTVAAYDNPAVSLPEFAITPGSLLRNLDGLLGPKPIAFNTNPEFARRYRLTGSDEAAVRALFVPDVIAYFESLDPAGNWTIEGTGHTVLIYRANKRVAPAELAKFLDDTSSRARTFFSHLPGVVA
jgi:hypothetical protein